MHDQHALGAEALHDAHQDADQIGVENAHQRVGRAGRIGQRAEDVEQGAHPHLAAHRRHVLHGAVMVGREHEAEAGFRDTGGNLLGRQHDVGAERLQHIGRTGTGRDAAPAVLGDFAAGRSDDKAEVGRC
jgi:hypothetical protein